MNFLLNPFGNFRNGKTILISLPLEHHIENVFKPLLIKTYPVVTDTDANTFLNGFFCGFVALVYLVILVILFRGSAVTVQRVCVYHTCNVSFANIY